MKIISNQDCEMVLMTPTKQLVALLVSFICIVHNDVNFESLK